MIGNIYDKFYLNFLFGEYLITNIGFTLFLEKEEDLFYEILGVFLLKKLCIILFLFENLFHKLIL
jgi:hypothetical protein